MRIKFDFPPLILIIFLLALSLYLPRLLISKAFLVMKGIAGEGIIDKAGTYQTVNDRLKADKKSSIESTPKPSLIGKWIQYIVSREYDQERQVLGWTAARKIPAVYTLFKLSLNRHLYKAWLGEFKLMPLYEQGTQACLIESRLNPHIVYPPLFSTPSLEGRLGSMSAFYKRLVENYPDLNVFIYFVKTSEYSQIYEELNPGTGYHRGITRLLNDFRDNLPESISYAQLDYDLNRFREYFYRSDHHWTIYAAWRAYAQIITMISARVDGIGMPLKPQMISKADNIIFRGTHAKVAAYEPVTDEIIDFAMALPPYEVCFNDRLICPRDDRGLLSLSGHRRDIFENYYAMYWGGDYGFIRYSAARGKRSLLMFVDSFSNCLEAYFTAHYSNIYVIDLKYYEKDMGEKFKLSRFLKNHPVDDVLFLSGNLAFFKPDELQLDKLSGE